MILWLCFDSSKPMKNCALVRVGGPWTPGGRGDPAQGRGRDGVIAERVLSFVVSRRVKSDQTAASLPSSPDPFKTPSRTSPLLPLPPYPPPEHTFKGQFR